jgi:hypothetical protein
VGLTALLVSCSLIGAFVLGNVDFNRSMAGEVLGESFFLLEKLVLGNYKSAST